MNIFFLARDPAEAARLHSDVHVIKMALETAQILCTTLWRHGVAAPYRPTHARHPSVLWAGDSLAHFRWTRALGVALCDEYGFRFDKVHASRKVIDALPEPPLSRDDWRDPPQSMPDAYKGPDAVAAYRAFYRAEKAVFPGKGPAAWTRRPVPDFMSFGA